MLSTPPPPDRPLRTIVLRSSSSGSSPIHITYPSPLGPAPHPPPPPAIQPSILLRLRPLRIRWVGWCRS